VLPPPPGARFPNFRDVTTGFTLTSETSNHW